MRINTLISTVCPEKRCHSKYFWTYTKTFSIAQILLIIGLNTCEFYVNSLTHYCTTSNIYFVVLVYFQKYLEWHFFRDILYKFTLHGFEQDKIHGTVWHMPIFHFVLFTLFLWYTVIRFLVVSSLEFCREPGVNGSIWCLPKQGFGDYSGIRWSVFFKVIIHCWLFWQNCFWKYLVNVLAHKFKLCI